MLIAYTYKQFAYVAGGILREARSCGDHLLLCLAPRLVLYYRVQAVWELSFCMASARACLGLPDSAARGACGETLAATVPGCLGWPGY